MSTQIKARSAFDYVVPVLVAGAGTCGLTAALSARAYGSDVLVIERDASPVGSTGMSYGAICAAGTKLQINAGISDDAEALAEDIFVAVKGQTDPDYAQQVASAIGPAMDWLISDVGIDLELETGWTGFGHRVPRLHAAKNRDGMVLMGMLQNAASSAGVDVMTEATLCRLYTCDGGDVTGVAIARPDGTIEEIGCETLILATCGFGANEEMVRENMPELAGADYYGHEGNTGDGILMAQQLGAAVADMGAYQALGALAMPHNLVIPHVILIGGGLQINAEGRRFENELDNISGQALTILDQPGGFCWMLTCEALHQDALTRFSEYQDAVEIGAVKSGDTVEQIAREMKVSADMLTAEMAEVAALVGADDVDRFGRSFKDATRLEGKLYATKVRGALFHTQGGLVVDDRARVKRTDGSVIPNLYAGGGAARGLAGPGNWGYLPGAGLMMAVALGYVAGQDAARVAQEATGI